MFCSVELAARIERAETDLIRSGAAVAAARADTYVSEAGGGVAVFTSPGSPLNKVAGLGFAPLADAELERIEAQSDARRLPVQVELASLGDPDLARRLTARGYALVGYENLLGVGLPAPLRPPAGVAVDEVGDADLAAWIDAVATGFAHPDTQGVASHEDGPMDRAVIDAVMHDFAATAGVRRFLARRAGDIVGGASMRTFGGVAHLAGAATLPAHRRRGVQTALVAHRLAVAAAAGCDLAVLVALPGSKSHENAQRQGFALLYSRAILVRAPR